MPWPPAPSGASELACRRRRAAAQRGVLTRRLRPSQPPLHRRRLPPRDRRLRQAAERDVGLRGRAPLRCRAGNTPTGQRFTTYSARVCPKTTSSKWRRCSSRATTPPMRGHHTRPATQASLSIRCAGNGASAGHCSCVSPAAQLATASATRRSRRSGAPGAVPDDRDCPRGAHGRRRSRGCLCPTAVVVASRDRAEIVTAPHQHRQSGRRRRHCCS